MTRTFGLSAVGSAAKVANGVLRRQMRKRSRIGTGTWLLKGMGLNSGVRMEKAFENGKLVVALASLVSWELRLARDKGQNTNIEH